LHDHERLLLGLTTILVLGIAAQYAAWRLKVPAILALLAAGLLAGPIAEMTLGRKLVDPDALLGPLVYPIVSISVALILFEGGLTLRVADLRGVGWVLTRLVSLGALVTWAITAVAARAILGWPWQLAVLLGAILVVTGPTVIGPLLRHVRPMGQVGKILKWEGIVIDPIGAVLALLVFESISQERLFHATALAISISIIKTVVIGLALGAASAGMLVLLLRRFWVADHLHNPIVLMLVVAAYAISNLLQGESGLLTVTVMGIALANQSYVPFKHILEFKESLSVVLIATLFVLLGSRLDVRELTELGWRTPALLAVLLFVARPASVWLATLGSNLGGRERLFLMCVAPRGIVAAAIASIFALRLSAAGYALADRLVPVTFSVILVTVAVYGLAAGPIARRLNLASSGKGGFLIAGANLPALRIAIALRDAGQEVVLADTNADNISAARLAALTTHQLSVLSEDLLERIEGTSIGRLLAITPNAEVNSLAALHFARLFGRSEVYQLATEPHESPRTSGGNGAGRSDGDGAAMELVSHELRGRVLFGHGMTYDALADSLANGAAIRRVRLQPGQTWDAFRAATGRVVPLFVRTGETRESRDSRTASDSDWRINTAAEPLIPRADQEFIALVEPLASTVADPTPA
jgi:NhaP-type Na+/H+ or K+/H+ antiporter